MPEKTFGQGTDEEDVKAGLEEFKDKFIVDGKFYDEPFGDECAVFTEEVFNTLSKGDDTCLLKNRVKKFVGCVSSALRKHDNCHEFDWTTDEGETVDACDWKGSMNLAWDMAKKIRCD